MLATILRSPKMMIPIASPFGSEAAVTVDHTDMGALALTAEFSGGIDREKHRLDIASLETTFFLFGIDHPDVVVSYDIVPSIRHSLLHKE